MSVEEDDWSNLPTDILHIILLGIPLVYHPNFASVCKRWNEIYMHKLHPIEQDDPLLIHVENWRISILNYYSPRWNKTFKVKSPFTLSESCFFSTKDGWLVIYKKVLEEEEEVEVVLANLVTNVSHSYPGLLHDYLFTGIAFSGCPGTEDFVIFGITSQEWRDDSITISVWKHGHWKLQLVVYENHDHFSMSPYSSPVRYKGSFYCVSANGKLGVFNPKYETWSILANPKGFSIPTSSKEVYLVESKDKITAVVGGNYDPRVLLIFRLDYKNMVWKKIKSFKSESMFIGPKASIIINFGKDEDGKETSKDNKETKIDKSVQGKKKSNGNGKPKFGKIHGVKNSEGNEEVEINKKVDDNGKLEGMVKEKIDVNGKAMKNRVYTTRIHGNVEAVEAEIKISDGRLFFVTKAYDHSKNKNITRGGNMLSHSLQNCKVDKYYGSSHYSLYCAWYTPRISCDM